MEAVCINSSEAFQSTITRLLIALRAFDPFILVSTDTLNGDQYLRAQLRDGEAEIAIRLKPPINVGSNREYITDTMLTSPSQKNDSVVVSINNALLNKNFLQKNSKKQRFVDFFLEQGASLLKLHTGHDTDIVIDGIFRVPVQTSEDALTTLSEIRFQCEIK